jgi:hypothetical protein
MGLGASATIASVFKINAGRAYFTRNAQDNVYYDLDFIGPSWIEIYLTIIGASVPTLGRLFMPGIRGTNRSPTEMTIGTSVDLPRGNCAMEGRNSAICSRSTESARGAS